MERVLFTLGGLSCLYCFVIGLFTGHSTNFYLIWGFMGVAFIVLGILWKSGGMTGITPDGCSGGRRGARVYPRDCDKICRLRTPWGKEACRPAFCQLCTSSGGHEL